MNILLRLFTNMRRYQNDAGIRKRLKLQLLKGSQDIKIIGSLKLRTRCDDLRTVFEIERNHDSPMIILSDHIVII